MFRSPSPPLRAAPLRTAVVRCRRIAAVADRDRERRKWASKRALPLGAVSAHLRHSGRRPDRQRRRRFRLAPSGSGDGSQRRHKGTRPRHPRPSDHDRMACGFRRRRARSLRQHHIIDGGANDIKDPVHQGSSKGMINLNGKMVERLHAAARRHGAPHAEDCGGDRQNPPAS